MCCLWSPVLEVLWSNCCRLHFMPILETLSRSGRPRSRFSCMLSSTLFSLFLIFLIAHNKHLVVFLSVMLTGNLPSVLWRCWLGGRKGIRPVQKLEWWGAGVVICLERDADLHMASLMPLPLTASCFRQIQIGFTFLVPAHPGSPGKRVVKRVCVMLTGK